MIYRNSAKRILDLYLGICALVLFAIPIILGVIAIKLSSPGPVFFFQTRVGRYGKTFRIFKLRTMTLNHNRHAATQVRNLDPDVFLAGRIMRRFKIDEMPQVINVILGDMSFVGPRPCLVETMDTMPAWARRRFEVRPGITGLAQTQGNTGLPWEKRWEQDIKYVDMVSLSLDAWLIFKTILVVIFGEEKFGSTA